jgi:hypothetical protein
MNRMPVATKVATAKKIPMNVNINAPENLWEPETREGLEPASALPERDQDGERISAANAWASLARCRSE